MTENGVAVMSSHPNSRPLITTNYIGVRYEISYTRCQAEEI